nr:MAG TPA: hypothetical protein [Bacteriophage sp.]
MERRIGEIFTYKGKTYQIVPREKDDCCIGCAFDLGKCACRKPRNEARSNFGQCYFRFREDKKGIIFKEIKNMEIKNNQLTIEIPEGMEIDTKNSDLAKGIIKFKHTNITYEDTVRNSSYCSLLVPNYCIDRLLAISKLMNIAKHYNGDWKPNWNSIGESKYYIYCSHRDRTYGVSGTSSNNYGNVYFRLYNDAKAVINNPNFRDILDAIYKN